MKKMAHPSWKHQLSGVTCGLSSGFLARAFNPIKSFTYFLRWFENTIHIADSLLILTDGNNVLSPISPFISRSTVLTTSKNSLSVGFCPSSYDSRTVAETYGVAGRKENRSFIDLPRKKENACFSIP